MLSLLFTWENIGTVILVYAALFVFIAIPTGFFVCWQMFVNVRKSDANVLKDNPVYYESVFKEPRSSLSLLASVLAFPFFGGIVFALLFYFLLEEASGALFWGSIPILCLALFLLFVLGHFFPTKKIAYLTEKGIVFKTVRRFLGGYRYLFFPYSKIGYCELANGVIGIYSSGQEKVNYVLNMVTPGTIDTHMQYPFVWIEVDDPEGFVFELKKHMI